MEVLEIIDFMKRILHEVLHNGGSFVRRNALHESIMSKTAKGSRIEGKSVNSRESHAKKVIIHPIAHPPIKFAA